MGLSPAPGMVLDCGRSRPEVIATRWSRSGLWFVLAVLATLLLGWVALTW